MYLLGTRAGTAAGAGSGESVRLKGTLVTTDAGAGERERAESYIGEAGFAYPKTRVDGVADTSIGAGTSTGSESRAGDERGEISIRARGRSEAGFRSMGSESGRTRGKNKCRSICRCRNSVPCP